MQNYKNYINYTNLFLYVYKKRYIILMYNEMHICSLPPKKKQNLIIGELNETFCTKMSCHNARDIFLDPQRYQYQYRDITP